MKTVAHATLVSLMLGAGSAFAQTAPFKVVVHRSNEVSSLRVEALSAYFMRKKTAWPNGLPVKPVDLDKDSRVRATFSKAVLDKQVSNVRGFWQRQVFLGSVVPPPEAPSDSWVLAYIAQNPGAVGYVAADTPTGPAIKVLEVVKVFAAK